MEPLKETPEDLTKEQKLDIIESHLSVEALAYRVDRYALRTSMDGETREAALNGSLGHLAHCDSLLDAYNQVRYESC